MAHFAGLVAAGLHPSPVPYADVVSTTIHKTIGGPRSGMILCKEKWAKKIDSAVFPGQQGGPLMHVVAAKAVALKIAASEDFKDRQARTLEGAQILADRLQQEDTKAAGVKVISGGTDVHLVLVDLVDSELDGQQAEDRLHEAGITVNRNAVPNDPRPPRVTSGLRIGTPLATRGFGAAELPGHRRDRLALTGRADVESLRATPRNSPSQPLYPSCSSTDPRGRVGATVSGPRPPSARRPGQDRARPGHRSLVQPRATPPTTSPRPLIEERMTAQILDGKATARRSSRARRASPAWSTGHRVPGSRPCWSATTRAAPLCARQAPRQRADRPELDPEAPPGRRHRRRGGRRRAQRRPPAPATSSSCRCRSTSTPMRSSADRPARTPTASTPRTSAAWS